MAQQAASEQVAKTDSRVIAGPIALSQTQQHGDPSAPSSNGQISPSGSKAALELSKLSAEREKIELEVAQMRDGALSAVDLREKLENEKEKSGLELRRLRNEVGNAKYSQYLELIKAFVPAGTIIASIWVAGYSLNYQRERDRSVEVSQQLLHFQDHIAATLTRNDKSTAPDVAKQRNAIAAIRSLRKDAIPSLLANLDLDHEEQIKAALSSAILELNDNPSLRQTILRELASSIKYAALQGNLPHLASYLALWRDCLREYERNDRKMLRHATALGNQLVADLRPEIRSKNWAQKDFDLMMNELNTLRSGQ